MESVRLITHSSSVESWNTQALWVQKEGGGRKNENPAPEAPRHSCGLTLLCWSHTCSVTLTLPPPVHSALRPICTGIKLNALAIKKVRQTKHPKHIQGAMFWGKKETTVLSSVGWRGMITMLACHPSMFTQRSIHHQKSSSDSPFHANTATPAEITQISRFLFWGVSYTNSTFWKGLQKLCWEGNNLGNNESQNSTYELKSRVHMTEHDKRRCQSFQWHGKLLLIVLNLGYKIVYILRFSSSL